MKVVRVCYMSKDGQLPEGIYADNGKCWYPVVYFRKAKWADPKVFRAVLDYIKNYRGEVGGV